MRISLLAAILSSVFVVVSLAGRLYADPISLNTSSQSSLQLDAGDDPADAFGSKVFDVNSLPASAGGTKTEGTSTSTAMATLSTSAFNFTFSGSVADPGYADGQATIYFTAGQGVSYALGGSLTSQGRDYDSELTVQIFDLSNDGEAVYNYDQTFNSNQDDDDLISGATNGGQYTLTLDDQSGDPGTTGFLNSVLTAGDEYEFYASESVSNDDSDPGLNGSIGISFTSSVGPAGVPEISASATGSLVMVLGGILAMVEGARIKSQRA